MKTIENKVALVTGAGSGIGKAIALKLADLDAKVVVADLNKEKAEEVVSLIKSKGKQAIGIAMDVSNETEVNQGFADAIKSFGDIDILISNAGIQMLTSLHECSLSIWKKMMAVNLDGAFLTTKAALNSMYKENRGGVVIYIGSIHSHVASKLKAPYCTAKHGLLGLSRTLAKEGASYGVRSYVICPGFVKTPLVEKQIPELANNLGISEEEVISKIALGETVDGQFTTEQEITDLIAFLCCSDSAALTGQSFAVSHGYVMK